MKPRGHQKLQLSVLEDTLKSCHSSLPKSRSSLVDTPQDRLPRRSMWPSEGFGDITVTETDQC